MDTQNPMGTTNSTSFDASLIRREEAFRLRGLSRSSGHLHVQKGLLPQPIHRGHRTALFIRGEIEALNRAEAAGATKEQIKQLVLDLVARRRDQQSTEIISDAGTSYSHEHVVAAVESSKATPEVRAEIIRNLDLVKRGTKAGQGAAA